jgi:glycolate oxidase
MSLPRSAYLALMDIVGPKNISEEPVILDTYSWMTGNNLISTDRTSFYPIRPEAILLPGSTEEVQSIVKACNQYGIKCKPFSTGWTKTAQAMSKDVIILDLRRMNRILEIDEKNMFAVVEPYVISAQLQAEAMKVGLNCHIIGAGASCSPLASATAAIGNGADGIFMGYSSETLLGMEWVMPDGEILRTGSLGSGNEWFCGEGPGPSLRGIIRGKVGVMGALGVFTKCALKLAPWPGPPVFPVQGTVPAYNSPLPDNIRTYTLVFPSWEKYADAIYEIYDAEICYIAHRQFSKLGEDMWPAFYTMYNDPTKSLDDIEEYINNPNVKQLTDEVRHFAFQIVLAGMTHRDLEYQEKVLDRILTDTGGHRVAAMCEPTMERFTALYLLKLPFKHLNNVFGGGKTQYFRPDGTPDFAVNAAPKMIEVLKKQQEKGFLPKTGGDSLMSTITGIGGGGDFHFEQFVQYINTDIESINAAVECLRAAGEAGFQKSPGLLPELEGLPEEKFKLALAAVPQSIRYHWQWKIKKMLDPNDCGDSLSYTTLEKPNVE